MPLDAQLAVVPGDCADPPLLLRLPEAARALGMSADSFSRHVRPEIRMVLRGSLKLVPRSELERWIALNALHYDPVLSR